MSNNSEFTSPVGRIVWGDLYVPNTKDFDGNQMTIKSGPDAGKPTQLYQFGLAVTKTQAHFANEPGWGQLAWAVAHAAFPGGDKSVAMSPDFSWKIEDGDSKTIGVKSKSKVRPCDREGYKGCWIIRFFVIVRAEDLRRARPRQSGHSRHARRGRPGLLCPSRRHDGRQYRQVARYLHQPRGRRPACVRGRNQICRRRRSGQIRRYRARWRLNGARGKHCHPLADSRRACARLCAASRPRPCARRSPHGGRSGARRRWYPDGTRRPCRARCGAPAARLTPRVEWHRV